MDEDEIDELIEQIEALEEEELGVQLFLEIFDAVGASEKAG
jgi:hypothetical protein